MDILTILDEVENWDFEDKKTKIAPKKKNK